MWQNCICSCVRWLEELGPPQHPSTVTEEDPQTQQGVKAWLDLQLVASTKSPGGMTLSNVTITIGGCASHSSCSKCSTGGRWDFSVHILRSPALQFWPWRIWESCLGALPPVGMVKVDLLLDIEKRQETRNNSCLPFVKLVMNLLHWLRPFKTLMATLAPCPLTVSYWPRTWAP